MYVLIYNFKFDFNPQILFTVEFWYLARLLLIGFFASSQKLHNKVMNIHWYVCTYMRIVWTYNCNFLPPLRWCQHTCKCKYVSVCTLPKFVDHMYHCSTYWITPVVQRWTNSRIASSLLLAIFLWKLNSEIASGQ